jgi:TatD DNase family protein
VTQTLVRYVDAHAHLTDPRFADVDDVITRGRTAGVLAVVTCGEDVDSSARALALAELHPSVSVAVGIHPHRATTCDAPALERLRALAGHPSVVAIGEVGIDLSGRSAPREAQELAFDAQVRLARELDLPIVVHVRDSGEVVRRRLDALPAVRGQIHCYSEGPDEVGEWFSRGFHLSFAGTLTFPRNERLRAAVRRTPAERLLFETDAPYLAPAPHRGRRNEPAYVAATVAAAARERDVEVGALAELSVRNARDLFGPRLASGSV